MATSVRDAEDHHRYELTAGDELVGVLVYHRGDGVLDLQHTIVYPGHEGQGFGALLARAALDGARASGLTVLPTCPYVASYVARHPEYADLVGSPS
jgi:predicted GNAT family acetyltransferase